MIVPYLAYGQKPRSDGFGISREAVRRNLRHGNVAALLIGVRIGGVGRWKDKALGDVH